jgi:hypothetical protein
VGDKSLGLYRKRDRVFKSHYGTSPSLPQTLTEGPDRHTVVCLLSLSLNIFSRRMEMI